MTIIKAILVGGLNMLARSIVCLLFRRTGTSQKGSAKMIDRGFGSYFYIDIDIRPVIILT